MWSLTLLSWGRKSTIGMTHSSITRNCLTRTRVIYALLVRLLTHWGRVTRICDSKFTIIGSDNGLSPGRRQAIIWTNAGILLIGTLGTNFRETLIDIYTFSFRKCIWKYCLWNGAILSRPQCVNTQKTPYIALRRRVYWVCLFIVGVLEDNQRPRGMDCLCMVVVVILILKDIFQNFCQDIFHKLLSLSYMLHMWGLVGNDLLVVLV